MDEILLQFFKTFADLNRLKMAALLSEEALTTEQISQRLQLRPGEVTRHLGQLEKLNLLVSTDKTYRLEVKSFEALSRQALAPTHPVHVESHDENANEFDQKIVRNYSLPDGRLKEIPLQEKKLLAILRHVVQGFEPGRRYTEKQVNEALKCFHEDNAYLRRALIDRQMLVRETNGSAYWRNA